MEELKSKLAEVLEEETVNDIDVLEDFEYWDSLAILGIISMKKTSFQLQILLLMKRLASSED